MGKEHKQITILTAADPEVGLGHLFRCDALAQAIQMQEGEQPQLIVSCKSGYKWLEKRAPKTSFTIANWNEDVSQTRRLISDAYLVIVDAYNIKNDVWEELRTNSFRLAVFDDTGEKPPFEGILINGSPGAHLIGYKDIPGRRLLLGTDYQVLRPPFWKRTERTVKENIQTVLIMAGGTDHMNIAGTIVEAVQKVLSENVKVVVIGERQEISGSRVKSVGFLSAFQLKECFDGADMLITAAGQTVAEAVSCALPTIMIQTVNNQSINVKGWKNTGAVLYAGTVHNKEWTLSFFKFIELIKRKEIRSEMSTKSSNMGLHYSTINLPRILLENSKAYE